MNHPRKLRSNTSAIAFIIVNTEGHRVVSVFGEIAFTNASDLKSACSDARRTIVDLRYCPSVDTSGFAVLRELTRTKHIVLVITPRSRCYRLFDLTQLLGEFQIFSSVTDAFAYLGRARGAPAL